MLGRDLHRNILQGSSEMTRYSTRESFQDWSQQTNKSKSTNKGGRQRSGGISAIQTAAPLRGIPLCGCARGKLRVRCVCCR